MGCLDIIHVVKILKLLSEFFCEIKVIKKPQTKSNKQHPPLPPKKLETNIRVTVKHLYDFKCLALAREYFSLWLLLKMGQLCSYSLGLIRRMSMENSSSGVLWYWDYSQLFTSREVHLKYPHFLEFISTICQQHLRGLHGCLQELQLVFGFDSLYSLPIFPFSRILSSLNLMTFIWKTLHGKM